MNSPFNYPVIAEALKGSPIIDDCVTSLFADDVKAVM